MATTSRKLNNSHSVNACGGPAGRGDGWLGGECAAQRRLSSWRRSSTSWRSCAMASTGEPAAFGPIRPPSQLAGSLAIKCRWRWRDSRAHLYFNLYQNIGPWHSALIGSGWCCRRGCAHGSIDVQLAECAQVSSCRRVQLGWRGTLCNDERWVLLADLHCRANALGGR